MSAESPFRTDLLAGKVALITGGATGINFGIAKAFGQHGAKLVLVGRREAVLEQARQQLHAAGIAVHTIQADVRSPEACERAVAAAVSVYGRLDVLVNGAAGNFLCAAEQLSPNAFKSVIDIDLMGTFNASRAAFEALRSSRGSIINISMTFQLSAAPWQAHASAAKAGVDSLTRSLALEWGTFGIRVNGIAPGPIKNTEAITRLANDADLSHVVPLGRMGTVEDIAYAACFLASEAASFVSGATLIVDGGNYLFKSATVPREMLDAMQSQRQRKPQSKL